MQNRSDNLLKPEDKYPLPARERTLLIEELLRSDALLLVAGIVLTIVFTGASSGDWFWTIVCFGWGYNLGQALTLGENPLMTIALALAIPLVACGITTLVERLMWARSESFRNDTYEIRHGLNGELPRLPVATLAALTALVGFSEEYAFRYGIISVLSLFFAQFFDMRLAVFASIAISAVLFAMLHTQYGRLWERLVVVVLALAFGLLLVVTGSLLAAALSHAAYDFVGLLLERRRMRLDECYFGEEPAPTNVVEKLMEEISVSMKGDD